MCSAILTAQIPSQIGYVTVVRTVYKVLAKIPGSALMSVKRVKWFISQDAVNQWIPSPAGINICFCSFLFLFLSCHLKQKKKSIPSRSVKGLAVSRHVSETSAKELIPTTLPLLSNPWSSAASKGKRASRTGAELPGPRRCHIWECTLWSAVRMGFGNKGLLWSVRQHQGESEALSKTPQTRTPTWGWDEGKTAASHLGILPAGCCTSCSPVTPNFAI